MAGESEWSVRGLEQVGGGTRPAKGQRVEGVPHGTRFVKRGEEGLVGAGARQAWGRLWGWFKEESHEKWRWRQMTI